MCCPVLKLFSGYLLEAAVRGGRREQILITLPMNYPVIQKAEGLLHLDFKLELKVKCNGMMWYELVYTAENHLLVGRLLEDAGIKIC